MRKKYIALSVPAVMLLSGCSTDGLGDVDSLSGVSLHMTDEGAPEVILQNPVEAEEESARILEEGDGEAIEEDALLHLSTAMADPETGEVQQEDFSEEAPSLLYLPLIEEQNEFIYESITDTGLNVGGEIAMYVPGAEGGGEPALIVVRVDDQRPDHAEGEVEEQSGELPSIINEVGEAPELEDFDPEAAEVPEEVQSEVLIQGEGEEVGPYDHLVMRYTGWRWSDGEVFDSAWPGVEPVPPEGEELPEGQEPPEVDEEQAVPPMDSPLPNLIPGWADALEGVQVGSRVVMVIPPEQAYGEATEEDAEGEGAQQEEGAQEGAAEEGAVEPQTAQGEEAPAEGEEITEEDMQELEEALGDQMGGQQEHPLAGETLVFVVDVVDAVPATDEQIQQYEEQERQMEEAEQQADSENDSEEDQPAQGEGSQDEAVQEESGQEETDEQPQGQEN